MPSVSKKQQKFMGIVRSIQKGEAPAGKFSKDAQDAAKKMKKSSVRKYAKTKHDDLPTKKEGVQKDRNELALHIIDLNNMLGQARLSKNPKAKKYIKLIQKDLKDAKKKLSKLKEERDYKAEYKKFQSSTKAKKYRAELNKYNRQKGTYGNGDGKDASHKGGKIVGFEKESVNRGRAEKSRLKKEANMPDFNPMIDKALDEVIEEYTMSRKGVIDKIATLAKANRYGTVDGTQMNGKSAKEIIAIYNHPKMKKFKKAMADYTVDDFVNLSIKLKKVLGIKVEAKVNINKKEMDKLHKGDKIEKDGTEIIFKEEDLMNENPAAIAAAQRMVVQNKMGKKVSVMTAKNASYKEKDPSAHNKAKSIWDRIKARFKKEGMNESIDCLCEACWKGYEKKGMKTMFGKRYPNCVKKKKSESVNEVSDKQKRKIYKKAFGKEYDDPKRKQAPLPLDIAYKVALNRLKKKEGVNENSAEKEKIFKYLVKKGDTPTDARYELNRSYDFVKKRYKTASVAKKAQIISDLSKYESVNEAVEMGKGVKKLMKIADEGYGKVGGTTVDSMSANLFKQLYDKANDDIKQKLNKKNEKQLVMIIGRMWKKFGKNVTIGSSV